MSHIFISYSRRDIDFAQRIVDALSAARLDTWIDWKSIPKGEDWEQEIYRGIEQADAFLFLISPHSVTSEMCNKEIAHAVRNGKRILPIFVANVGDRGVYGVVEKFLQQEQKEEIGRRNFILCREGRDDFSQAIAEIQKTVHTDYEWLRYHTELQVKALEWQKANDVSRLLRGKELREADEALARAGHQKEPQPTDLQRGYLLESHRSEERQRRRITISLGLGLAVVTALAIFAWGQRNTAVASEETAIAEGNARATALVNEEQARATALAERDRADEQAQIARARELAAHAVTNRSTNFSGSMLLGVEAYRAFDNYETRKVLFENLQAYPHLRQYLYVGGTLTVLAVNADRTILATGSCDVPGNCPQARVVLWNAADRSPIGKPLPYQEGIFSLDFSPDGNTLATGSWQVITLWDVATQEMIGQPIPSRGMEVKFSPDGTLLMSSGSAEGPVLWDVKTQNFVGSLLEANGTPFPSLFEFSPDQKYLATARTDENDIKLWDASNGWSTYRLLSGHSDPISSVAFRPDSRRFASGSADRTILLWDPAEQQPALVRLSGHSGAISSITFGADGKILASSSAENEILLWDAESGLPLSEPFNGPAPAFDLFFGSDQNTLISASKDNNVAFWDLDPRPPLRRVLVEDLPFITDLAFSPDGSRIASAHGDGVIRIWYAATGEQVAQLTGHEGGVNRVAYHPDGKYIASAGDDLKIILWDIEKRQPVYPAFAEHHEAINGLAFSGDGSRLASSSQDHTILIWNVATGEAVDRLTLTTAVNQADIQSLVFSPDGRKLAAVEADVIHLFDLTAQPVTEQQFPGLSAYIQGVSFSPDGTRLTSIDARNHVLLWDIATRTPINTRLPGADMWGGCGASGAFTSDGSLAVSSDLTLWDLNALNPYGKALLGASEQFCGSRMVFHPQGTLLASFNQKESASDVVSDLLLWDMRPASWVDLTCARAGRNLTQAEWQQYFPDEEYSLTCPQWPAGE